jgi:hypothetical protein
MTLDTNKCKGLPMGVRNRKRKILFFIRWMIKTSLE